MNYDKEEIKTILLTDYIDGELSSEEKNRIDGIIQQDEELQLFLKTVQETEASLSSISATKEPPAQIWENIRQRTVVAQQEEYVDEPSLIDRLVLWWEGLTLPSWQLAVGLAVVVVLSLTVIDVPLKPTKKVAYNQEAQVDYLFLLTQAETGLVNGVDDGFETSIENYFL